VPALSPVIHPLACRTGTGTVMIVTVMIVTGTVAVILLEAVRSKTTATCIDLTIVVPAIQDDSLTHLQSSVRTPPPLVAQQVAQEATRVSAVQAPARGVGGYSEAGVRDTARG
jgi:hypothetical protein